MSTRVVDSSLDPGPLSFAETFGLSPWRKRLDEVFFMLRGDPYTPPSRFGVSSLRIFFYRLAIDTWLGRTRDDRRIPIYNLFNHTPTPIEDGWSVRKTQVCDYRGRDNTYDSHNGTDFAIPVGTVVVAPAPGRVIRVCNEFHRGGLKVIIDHGQGIVTTSNHLGRALVEPGQHVARAEPIALSGASGVDMVAAFPWNCPHVHFNVWLNGENVDPFAAEEPGDEVSIWRKHNDPVPHTGPTETAFEPTQWDEDAIAETIDGCRDPELAAALRAETDPVRQAGDVLFHVNYFPTRFERRPLLYRKRYARRPLLDLPFRAEDFVGIVHIDEEDA